MNPTREDIERDFKVAIPENAELLYGETPPDNSFLSWGWCKEKYQVFIKSSLGRIIAVYILLGDFIPLPTPYEIVVLSYPHAVEAIQIAWNDLRSQKPIENPAYVALMPPTQSTRPHAGYTSWGSLTAGTSVVTLSGTFLQAEKAGPEQTT